MKTNFQLLALVFFFALGLSAQEYSISVGYQYIYSAEWDNAIQRYNFARASSDDTQPLLVHGTYLDVSYFFASDKRLKSGIKLAHGFSRSTVTNQEKVSLHLHQLELGYTAQYTFQGTLSDFFLEVDVSGYSTLLSRRVDNEVELLDEEKNRTFGFGVKFGGTAVYKIEIKGRKSLSPFLGMGYSPYLSSPESESILDPSIGINGTKDIQVYSWKLGVRWTFN